MEELTIMSSLKTHLHFALFIWYMKRWLLSAHHLTFVATVLSKEVSISASKEPFKIPQVSGNTLKTQPEITSTGFQSWSSSDLFGKHG